jgi:RHS repeat-associated protein
VRRFIFALLIASVTIPCLAQSYLQDGLPPNSFQVPVPLGSVSPDGGRMHLEIPLASSAVRGDDPNIVKMIFDSTTYLDFPGYGASSAGPGWRFVLGPSRALSVMYDSTPGACDPAYPLGNSYTYTNFRVVDNNGTVSTMIGSVYTQSFSSCYNSGNQQDPNPGRPSGANWGTSGYYFNITNYTQAQVWALDGSIAGSTDTNGNTMAGPGGNGDDLGRTSFTFATTCPIGYNINPCNDAIGVKNSDGSTSTYTINFQPYAYCQSQGCTGKVLTVSSIVLPDTTQYTFNYDSGNTPTHYADLSSITLPTGGVISYSYVSEQVGGDPLQRYTSSVTYGGNTWSFSYNLTTGSTTVVSPPRYDYTTKTNVSDTTIYSHPAPYQKAAQFYSGTNTLLKTITYNFSSSAPAPVSVVTTLNDTGQSSQVQYQYLPGCYSIPGTCPIVTQIQEYDFGSSTPTRTTKIGYLQDTSSIKYNSVYHILNRPVSRSIYAGSGTGSPIATTNYTYDEYGASYCKNNVPMLTSVTGATGHDDAGHGSTFWARGNVTSISKLVSGTTYLTAHKCYDTLGNVTQEVDAAGNPTSYDYTDNWADTSCIASGTVTRAFPTTITDALGHRTKTTRYSCTSLSSAVADENDIQAGRAGTTYAYDWANRPLCTNYADGGQTCRAYFPTAQPAYSTETTLITSSLSEATKAIVDSYGRVTQTQLTSDPESTDYADTTYDAFGRTASVSNPYRSTSDPTYGLTSYYYDALGRGTFVVQPDGSVAATSYSGNTATATDEAGNKRKTQTDGLSRLAFVWEDPSNLNYETDYTYDLLDNMVGVTQKGGASSGSWRTRTFTYDALSRLLCAANPEIQRVSCPASASGPFPAGAVTYTYDSVSNVRTKTAPSPNQPTSGTATVTTNYTYDALNRLNGRSYVDSYAPNPATQSVSFGYDGVALTGCTTQPPADTDSNPIGRRTSMCDGSGAASWKHDTMGRILQERRTIGGVLGKYETDVYNLDGSPTNVTTLGYAVAYTYGGAGRALTATNYTGGTNKLVTGATYAPPGALTAMTMGSTSSFAGIVTNNAYSNRLQPILLSAGVAGQNPVFSDCFDFHLATAVTAPSPCSFSASALGDNGNLYQIVNNRVSTRTEILTYDALNRISSGQSNGPQWGETFNIDAWGNLTNEIGISGKTYHEGLNTSAGTNNQLAGFGYDAAGNMSTNGSVSYVYDAENRLIATGGYSYIYDGDGERVEKCTEGTTPGTCATGVTGTLYWRGADSAPLSETDLAGNVQNNYIFFNGQRIARRDSAGLIHYYFSDHLGSHGVVENATASACEQDIDYYPYGGVQSDYCANLAQNYKFTAHERDSESSLDYFGVRHFSSALGRFMVPDPGREGSADASDPQSWNLYAYVLNNPIRFVDMLGFYPCPVKVTDSKGGGGRSEIGDCQDQGDGCMAVSYHDATTVYCTPPKPVSTTGSRLRSFLAGLQQGVQDATQATWNFITAPRDPGCMAAKEAKYGAAGTGLGLVTGGVLGVETGPGAILTAGAGGVIGGSGGAFAGGVGGLFTCMSGGGGGGGGSSGGGGAGGGRPKGVPDTWKKVASRNGMDKWVDPNNPHNFVRMRTDGTITQVRNGMALDASGGPVPQNSPEAHFPASQFIFRP